jgi:hypothetical protein
LEGFEIGRLISNRYKGSMTIYLQLAPFLDLKFLMQFFGGNMEFYTQLALRFCLIEFLICSQIAKS